MRSDSLSPPYAFIYAGLVPRRVDANLSVACAPFDTNLRGSGAARHAGQARLVDLGVHLC